MLSITKRVVGVRKTRLRSRLVVLYSSLLLCTTNISIADESIKQSRYKRAGMNDEVDPNVALEGQCIVVCDADVVARAPQIRSPPPPVEETRNGPVNDFWDRMQTAACGGLVNVGKRRRRVAFSVKRQTDLTTSASSENNRAIVTFDYVILNERNGFDTKQSTFVAPVSGIYSFSFQVYRIFNKDTLTVDLTVNEDPLLRGIADGDIAKQNSAHNTGLIRLAAKDRVWLQKSSGNLDSGWKDSTFSGYLVFEDDEY